MLDHFHYNYLFKKQIQNSIPTGECEHLSKLIVHVRENYELNSYILLTYGLLGFFHHMTVPVYCTIVPY